MAIEELPRRLRLGIQLGKEPFRDGGLVAAAVMPGSFAAGAGVLPGDVVRAIGAVPIPDAVALRAALRRESAADEIALEVARAGVVRRVRGKAVRVAVESFAGGSVRLATLARADARLRVLVTLPPGEGPHPAVVFLQGIACNSIDYGGVSPLPALGELLHELTRHGLATLRLERRGLGDSEGPPAATIGFGTELDDLRALVEPAYLRALGCDPDRLALFGHSVGGMMLPSIAEHAHPRAAIVAGSSRRVWTECVAGSTRRQVLLRGGTEAEAQAEVARETDAILNAAPDEVLFGRTVAFSRELQNANIGAAFDRLACPLLVVQGEHDWVVGEDEGRHLVARAPAAELWSVPGMDHSFGVHASLGESVAAYGKGRFEPTFAAGLARFVLRHIT